MEDRQRLLLCSIISVVGLLCAYFSDDHTAVGCLIKYPLSGAIVGAGLGILVRNVNVCLVGGSIFAIFMSLLL